MQFSEFSVFQRLLSKNSFMISFSPLHAMSVHHGICPIMNDIKYVVVNLQKSVFQIEMNLKCFTMFAVMTTVPEPPGAMTSFLETRESLGTPA